MIQRRLNGRYELVEKLGEGGVAIVYRALDTILDRTVAIKVLREQLTGDPAFLERFRREAQAAARLSHPSIISIYDVGQDDNWHYIIMEYIEGQDLKAFIAEQHIVPPALALAISEQVCAALDHAHQLGFVHRDIKPQNILLARAESANGAPPGPVVKVADFGLARSVSGVTSSEGGLVLGTVHYMSPEQAGGEPATPASDIYSLGVALYEMLTGRLPFESESPVGLALKHIQEQPIPPAQVNPRLAPALSELVLRALAKSPAQRFASAREMGQALAAYRQFGEQATGRMQPVRPAASTGSASSVAGRVQPVRPAASTGSASGGAGRVQPVRPAASTGSASAGARPGGSAATRQQSGFDWLLLALFVVTFIALAGLAPLALLVREAVFPPAPTPAPQVTVPDIVGLEQAVAGGQLQSIGLTLVVQDGRFDNTVPPQRILTQLTPAGTRVSPGHVIEVIVSRGREKVKMPPLVGLPLAEAQSKVGNLGLQVEQTESRSLQVQAGFILRQDPAPESEVERGGLVRLVVSVGDRVMTPELFGKLEADAQRIIREAGLSTTFSNPQGPNDVSEQSRWVFGVVPVGGVISQQPAAGEWVERGTVVRIAIRKP